MLEMAKENKYHISKYVLIDNMVHKMWEKDLNNNPIEIRFNCIKT